MGRDSSAGVVTHYGLDGPGIESRWGTRISAPVQTSPGAYPASYPVGTGSYPMVKQLRCGVDHPPLSSAEVRERVELYIYSPSGPSWPVLGWTLLYVFSSAACFDVEGSNFKTENSVQNMITIVYSVFPFMHFIYLWPEDDPLRTKHVAALKMYTNCVDGILFLLL